MVTKVCDFQHKIYYNLACVGETAQMHARNRATTRARLSSKLVLTVSQV